LNTEIAIPPKFWHKKIRRIQDTLPKEYGDAKSLNEEVYRMYSVAEKIIQFALTNKVSDPVAGKFADIDHHFSFESDHSFSLDIDHPFSLRTDHP
jgi:hypothetical protein